MACSKVSVSDVVEKYQLAFCPNLKFEFSNKRPTLGHRGIGNIVFYMCYMCMDRPKLVEFLRETGLVKSDMFCPKCSGEMRMAVKNSISDGLKWVCRKKACAAEASFRFGSWFSCSKLNLEEIVILSFLIVTGESTSFVKRHFFFSSGTMADWRQFINEVILDYIELNSEKIGGPGKIVEVDESKFGKRKHNRGHPVEGQWVFGGVERDTGRLFLVAVGDRSKDTLHDCIETWIEKGTTIYSDCWKAYESLGEKNYNLLQVNHSVNFVDPVTGCHTNHIECRWRHVKATLPEYNRQSDFQFYLANYMFNHKCVERNVDVFNAFLELVRDIDWDQRKIVVK